MLRMFDNLFFFILTFFFHLCLTTISSEYDVIVIGAGASGLAAAIKLLDNNVTNFIILEARDRIGGRVYSVPFGGVLVDLGTPTLYEESVNQKETDSEIKYVLEIRGLNQFKMEEELSINFVQSRDKILSSPDMVNFTGPFSDFLYPRLCSKMKELNVTNDEMEIMLDIVKKVETSENGADPEVLSTRGIWEYNQAAEEHINEDPQKSIQFFKGAEKETKYGRLMDKVLLNHEVIKVSINNGVTIGCSNGKTYHSKRAILTLPLGVLKELSKDFFDPELPQRTQEVIKVLGNGISEVVFLKYSHKWWPEKTCLFGMSSEMKNNYTSHSKYDYWADSISGIYNDETIPLILEIWVHGRVVEEHRLMDNETAEAITELLQNFLGNDSFRVPMPEALIKSNWLQDQCSKGSFSYRTIEADKKNISGINLAEPILDSTGKPVLLFAGEATHPNYFGSLPGAIESGYREAEHMLEIMRLENEINQTE